MIANWASDFCTPAIGVSTCHCCFLKSKQKVTKILQKLSVEKISSLASMFKNFYSNVGRIPLWRRQWSEGRRKMLSKSQKKSGKVFVIAKKIIRIQSENTTLYQNVIKLKQKRMNNNEGRPMSTIETPRHIALQSRQKSIHDSNAVAIIETLNYRKFNVCHFFLCEISFFIDLFQITGFVQDFFGVRVEILKSSCTLFSSHYEKAECNCHKLLGKSKPTF